MFDISQLTKGTEVCFCENYHEFIRMTNRFIKFGVENKVELCFVGLDSASMKVADFSDASLAGSRDLTS